MAGISGIKWVSNTSLYQRWADMKTRCHCKTNNWFHRYGGRGIKVCQEWQKFEPFRLWAESNGFDKNLVLDRIDNDGDYKPSNCRWATKSESMYNREFKTNHPGVRKLKTGWVAKASNKHLGYFDTKEEAQKARDRYFETGEILNRKIRRKRSDNISGHPGIFKRKTGKWMVKFKNNYLGQFDTFEEALDVRKKAERECK